MQGKAYDGQHISRAAIEIEPPKFSSKASYSTRAQPKAAIILVGRKNASQREMCTLEITLVITDSQL
ncbi:hypothetical protein EUGRSUZ_B03005 [Eucalyptus grandis]|uniref:Uncharacterized protein n=2 Tax=Eucalyptus grandis TaxID=71139 RepID=A0ACC3LVT8_EUCGR|nr:hypothetical protein EUGRSUZ_B03005 [Eucalyptus grandis]